MSLIYFYDTTTCKCNTENTSTISRAIYIYIYIYIHCRKIQNLFVRALETGRKVSLWRDFLACFASSQINFIFNDNVGKLCLSCNIKESKTTAKLFDNSWNKHRSDRFQWGNLWRLPYTVTVSFPCFTWIIIRSTII
jgi:hypothetical protein